MTIGVQEDGYNPTIRTFFTDLRTPQPYIPVGTEVRGIANIAIGLLEMVRAPLAGSLASHRFNNGLKSFEQGTVEFFPGVIFYSCIAHLIYTITS